MSVHWPRPEGSDVTVFDILETGAFLVVGASRETRQVVLDGRTWHVALDESRTRLLQQLLQNPSASGAIYLDAGHRLMVAPNPANGTVALSLKAAFLPDLTTPRDTFTTVIPAEHLPKVGEAVGIALAAACPQSSSAASASGS
ncbi:hypothetical protein ETD86_29420 [Nonomuraea turkmeniaca]|uniref:Uncharacterized protein n=1 Tax=Nonomuraea turkmeniaca TaxID=103838 RepID=A0A5S4FA14_9ACTN|nr:hypothetical protein [Nonomuraea turkmeniaca]TMR14068.1 hypothetical protein ETD86_29420 [Nonomuraea turkmeniaca]